MKTQYLNQFISNFLSPNRLVFMSPAKAEIQAQDPDVAAVNEHIGFDPEKEAGVIKKKVQEAGEGIKERVDAETQRLALSMDIAVGEKNLKKIREDLKVAEKVYGEVQGVIDLVKKEGGSKMALDMAIKDAEPAERKFRELMAAENRQIREIRKSNTELASLEKGKTAGEVDTEVAKKLKKGIRKPEGEPGPEHNILMAKIWDNAEIRNKAGEFIEENLENYSSGDWFKLNKQFARIFGIKTNDMDEIGKYIKALQIEIGAEDDGCFGRDTMTALYPVFERKGYFERNLTNPVDIAASEYARWTNQRVSSDNKFFRKYFNKAYEELGAPEDFDGGMPTWAHAMTEKMYDLEDQARDSKEEVAVAQVVDEEAPEWETHDFSTGRTEMPNEEDVEVATGFTGSDADMDSDIDADADTDFDDRDKA